jgi:hypothetical protein
MGGDLHKIQLSETRHLEGSLPGDDSLALPLLIDE